MDVLRRTLRRLFSGAAAPWLRGAVPRPRPRGRTYALIGAVQRGPEQRALRTRTLKLIEYPLGRRPDELYLIAGDPRERRDVARRRTPVLARAQRQLERAWSRLGEPPEASPPPLDPETLERLKALGYVP